MFHIISRTNVLFVSLFFTQNTEIVHEFTWRSVLFSPLGLVNRCLNWIYKSSPLLGRLYLKRLHGHNRTNLAHSRIFELFCTFFGKCKWIRERALVINLQNKLWTWPQDRGSTFLCVTYRRFGSIKLPCSVSLCVCFANNFFFLTFEFLCRWWSLHCPALARLVPWSGHIYRTCLASESTRVCDSWRKFYCTSKSCNK